MTTKILRSDGTTELTGIKSCTFTERINAVEDLKPGCVASAYINVVVYGSQSTAPAAGEALKYYQVDGGGNETLIGTFYAEPSIPSRDTYAFVAYDAVSKLDADFSGWLSSNQSNFPMTIYALVSAACTVAGVTLASSSWANSTMSVNAFYADGITCRNILAYASEIACSFVRCNSSGGIVFGWYTANSTQISPSGSGTSVAYKQDGLTYDNYTASIDAVSVYHPGQDGAAYTYPSAATGNIVQITNNALLYGATESQMSNVAQTIYNGLNGIGPYRPSTIKLFPFENPFRAGDIVTVTDVQGVTLTTVVMSMMVSESVATLESYGHDEVWNERDTSKETIQLAADAVRMKYLIAEKADIDLLNVSGSVIANRIDATTLMAKNLTATGKFEVNNGSYRLEQSSGGLSIRTGNATPSTGSEFYLTDSDIGMRIDATRLDFIKNTTTQAIRVVLEANNFEIGGNTLIKGNLTTAGTTPGPTSNNIGDSLSPWNTLYVSNINLNGTTYSSLSSSFVPWSNYASGVSSRITLTSNNVVAGLSSVTIYVRFTAGSISSGATLWTVASEYAPIINYPILSVRSVTSPYLEVGTVWLGTDGAATLYGTLTSGTGYYVTGTYTI